MNLHAFRIDVDDGCARLLDGSSVSEFVHEILLAPARDFPVVGVTTSFEGCLVDGDLLAHQLRGRALVVVIPRGPATYTLRRELSRNLFASSGHVRLWMPGLRRDSRPWTHPLVRIEGEWRADAAVAEIVQLVHAAPLPRPRPTPPRIVDRSACAQPKGVEVPWDPRGPNAGEEGHWHCDW